jgi:parallel beta-helix repeat protein
MKVYSQYIGLLLSVWLLAAMPAVQAQKSFQKALQTKLIEASDGDTIHIEAGRFTVDGTLSLEGKKHITIRGKGMDATVLSFKNQATGAEGLRVNNCEQISLEGFTVEDAKGDAIKVEGTKGIRFYQVKTAWTGTPSSKNGAYGLYPVNCSQVTIDACVAIGASDAGIYVGQSSHIVVKNSKAYHNVAGIEIENSLHAEVYDNEAYQNTGGILVFDLPDLVQKKGGHVKVYRNKIYDNNFPNFAPKGNIVAKVPDGTGILILATNNVEIYNNTITNNKSVGTGIFSYLMTENPITDAEYYPYPQHIHIYDNDYQRMAVKPTGRGRIGQMFRFKLRFGKDVPHIIYDGIRDPDLKDELRICIRNNRNQSFVNIDAANNFKQISKDISPYNCQPESAKVEGKN